MFVHSAAERGTEEKTTRKEERSGFISRPMQYRFLSPRRKILPPLTAALARLSSPMSLVARTSRLSPAFNTKLFPALAK